MENLGSFIEPLMNCIGPPVIRQFGYLKAKENVDKLIKTADDVEAARKDIEDQIDAASRVGKRRTEKVARWIERVKRLGHEVRTVRNDYAQRGRCWQNCWSSYKIGRSASKLLIEMTDLKDQAAGLGDLARDAPPAPVEQMSSTSDLVGNMINLNKEKICRYLREETNGVIGIWGMGGVGKTTLLEAINDNFLNNNNGNSGTADKLFDPVLSIVVSKEHQLENLQRSIVQRLRLLSSDDLVSQARIISEYLKEKNFLLLLDDIWEVVQLKDLGIPHLHSNSSSNIERRFRRKVVFTTRSWQVCASMKCHQTIKVKCLEADEAWDLFNKNVGGDIIDLPDIRSCAKKVTEECGGLPLALVVIGRAMSTKRSPQEWDYALTQLKNSQPSNIPGIMKKKKEDYYFWRLKFSYDSLENDKMRECFLCCSLWPEDYPILKTDLIMCWMGLGLIKDFGDIDEAYGEGHTFIGSLIAAGLLEPANDDREIKMHDVIRDLALWIARDCGENINKWLVKAGVGLEEVPKELVGAAERVSLMKNNIKELPSDLPPCPNLSTLILEGQGIAGIPSGFFTSMSELTYLDLSSTGLQDIPKEICHLKQLRYLNLSHTRISKLPEELAQLTSLKYLLLGWTRELKVEARRIIGRLPELEYLDLYRSGAVDELQSLPLSLKGVGMSIRSEHALKQLPRVVPPVLHLAIENIGGDSSSTTSIHLHHLLSSRTKKSLRLLCFEECRSIRELVVGADVRLPSLESLYLWSLENLTVIVAPSECFERLRRLSISGCGGLKDITWVLHLPCLEILDLACCKEMEQLVVIGGGGEEVTKPTFPRLRELSLRGLPKLAMICDNHIDAAAAAVNFPSLEELRVDACEGLKKLPFHPQLPLNNNCSRLKEIICQREWWDAIEWEDQSAQSYLQPYLVGFS